MINMKKSIRMIPFRRKREGKTNYDKRMKLLKSGQIRLLVSYGSKGIRAQAIKFNLKGDEILADATANLLREFGWKFTCPNLPTSYLFGYYFGKLLVEKKVSLVIFDTGMVTPKKGGKYYAFAKGVVDSKISMQINPEVFPSEERIKGSHISGHAKLLKENGLYDKRYSYYLKEKIDVEKITDTFSMVLDKIKQSEKLSKVKSNKNPTKLADSNKKEKSEKGESNTKEENKDKNDGEGIAKNSL
jgi:large subunit ribosomal protein L18